MNHNADKPHDHPHAAKAAQSAAIGKGWARSRVAMMDCANKESEVGRAVDGIAGIRALTFQLGNAAWRWTRAAQLAQFARGIGRC